MTAYVGSSPYCYSSSFAMVMGEHAAPIGTIETLTGSAFGAQIDGGMAFFDPIGWNPEIGLDSAIELLGWSCTRSSGGTPDEAVARLRSACTAGPVLAGPLELGLLTYRPRSGKALGADHYVAVLGVESGRVLLHDPQGHPYVSIPVDAFVAAWRGEEITYGDTPFAMRSEFRRDRVVAPERALADSLPQAVKWLTGSENAVQEIADMVSAGLDPDVRELLAVFGVRLGARRLHDAAQNLRGLNRKAAAVAAHQSRILGGLQYDLMTGDDPAFEIGLRRLAPGYAELRAALSA